MNANASLRRAMAAVLAATGGAGTHSLAASSADARSFTGRQDAAGSQASDALTIREQAAGFLILLVHDDSPWTLGRTVEAAARYRSSLSGAGPLLIRHDHTFPVLPDARPRFSVGFLVSERMEVAPPFRIEAQRACEVASKLTDGPAWKTGACVTRMITELSARGLEPAAPFIELIDASSAAAPGEAQRSRLEVAVRARGGRGKEVAPAQSASRESESAESPSPESATGDIASAVHVGRTESASATDPPPPSVLHPSRDARAEVLAFMNSVATTADSVQWPVTLWERADASTGTDASRSAPDAGSDAGSSPAARLFVDRRYDELADTLLPKRRKFSRDQREWLARVLAGMNELEIAVRDVDASFADELRKLNEAIHLRAESVRLDLPEPKDQGPRGQRRSVAGADGQSIVLAALLAWSSEPASGGTDPGSRREKLAGILSRIEGVLGEP